VLVDASTVNAPGNTGIDWRVHLGFDLASFQIRDVKLTDVRGGEALRRYHLEPGDVAVADRGYSRRTDLAAVNSKGCDYIVRLNWRGVPLIDLDGEPFDFVENARRLPEAEIGEFNLKLKPDPSLNVPSLPVRLIAVRKSEAAAAADRERILRRCSKQQKTPDPRTLEMAAYMFIATSLPAERLPADEVLEVYRFRWQVELVFKRMKSLIDLNGLPAKDPDLAKTFIYSKILAALLLEDFTEAFISFSPWGFVVK
jgi:IS4 transposase